MSSSAGSPRGARWRDTTPSASIPPRRGHDRGGLRRRWLGSATAASLSAGRGRRIMGRCKICSSRAADFS
jgi:hypothetical protein